MISTKAFMRMTLRAIWKRIDESANLIIGASVEDVAQATLWHASRRPKWRWSLGPREVPVNLALRSSKHPIPLNPGTIFGGDLMLHAIIHSTPIFGTKCRINDAQSRPQETNITS